jgi:hypothetical protein
MESGSESGSCPARRVLNPRKEEGQNNNPFQLFSNSCLETQHSRFIANFCLRKCCLEIRSASCSARTRTHASVASLTSAPGRGSAGSARRHARIGRDRVLEDKLTVSMVRCVICCRLEMGTLPALAGQRMPHIQRLLPI